MKNRDFKDILKLCLIFFLFLAVVGLFSSACFPDPEPSCPQECEEVRDGGDLTACKCDPGFFDDYCEDRERPGPFDEPLYTEDECEDL